MASVRRPAGPRSSTQVHSTSSECLHNPSPYHPPPPCLTQQQADVLRGAGLRAEAFGGRLSHARMDAGAWRGKLRELEALVMTPGMFRAVLMHGFIKVSLAPAELTAAVP